MAQWVDDAQRDRRVPGITPAKNDHDGSTDLVLDLIAGYGLEVSDELRVRIESDPAAARAVVANWFRSC